MLRGHQCKKFILFVLFVVPQITSPCIFVMLCELISVPAEQKNLPTKNYVIGLN
jgi:hypothetical protein